MKHLLWPCLLFCLNTYAARGFEGCGLYHYKGLVQIKDKKMNLLINQGTKSELTFHLSIQQEAQLAPYLNRPVTGKMHITKPLDGTRAHHFTLMDTQRGTIDPLHPMEHSFLKKLESQKCH